MATGPYLSPGDRDTLVAEIEECEGELRQLSQGDPQANCEKLLLALERHLHLMRRLHAEASEQVVAACRKLCEACNFAATRLLNANNLKGALELLKRAEEVADKSDLDRAVTWNNLAVYYRRAGKLRTAVTFLERALAIEEHLDTADAAQTHLNLCATLSQLQRHADAILHAQSALIRVFEFLSPSMLNGELTGDLRETDREQVSVLCIAYHNLAVEHEYLKNFDAALCAYTSGKRWAERFLDESHQLVGILSSSVEAVRAKLPHNSVALRRADRLAVAFRPAGGRDHQHLLTPRNHDDSRGARDRSSSGDGAGN